MVENLRSLVRHMVCAESQKWGLEEEEEEKSKKKKKKRFNELKSVPENNAVYSGSNRLLLNIGKYLPIKERSYHRKVESPFRGVRTSYLAL